MTLLEILRRYFMANAAPIFAIRRATISGGGFIPCHGGNFGGFIWRGWQVIWRKPYCDVWAFDPRSKRWLPRYMVEVQP